MEKFVGTVNGKTFDNVEDFSKAASKAIKSNDGNLSISSYYTSGLEEEEKISEPVEEKTEKKVEKDSSVKEEEYLISDQKPAVSLNGSYYYQISDELQKKLVSASNETEIVKNLKKNIDAIDDTLKNDKDKINALQSEIESLQDKLFENEEEYKKKRARRTYYQKLIDTINAKDDIRYSRNFYSSPMFSAIAYLKSKGLID